MRWRKKYNRIVKRFAIFPVETFTEGGGCDREYRWLETVYLQQHRDYLFGMFPFWKTTSFVSENIYNRYLERNNHKKEEEK